MHIDYEAILLSRISELESKVEYLQQTVAIYLEAIENFITESENQIGIP